MDEHGGGTSPRATRSETSLRDAERGALYALLREHVAPFLDERDAA